MQEGLGGGQLGWGLAGGWVVVCRRWLCGGRDPHLMFLQSPLLVFLLPFPDWGDKKSVSQLPRLNGRVGLGW